MFKDFEKARTPKFTDFHSFNQILPRHDPTSDPNLRGVKSGEIKKELINVDTHGRPAKNYYLEMFKALTNAANKSQNRRLKGELSGSEIKYSNLLKSDELNLSPAKSQNKSQVSDSHKKSKKKEKTHKAKLKHHKKRAPQQMSMLDEEITHNITLLHHDDQLNETMKKTLEENNKEREINLFNENETSKFKNQTFKYASAPVSNKNSDVHDSIFSSSMKLAAYRASELKKKNQDLIQKYGRPDKATNPKYEREFIKKLHSAALTIQNFWRDFILTRKDPLYREGRQEFMDMHRYDRSLKESHPNNNRSTSRNACSVPKLDLSQVQSKKLSETSNQEGKFCSRGFFIKVKVVNNFEYRYFQSRANARPVLKAPPEPNDDF